MHPFHVTRLPVYSQDLRIKRLCSAQKTFEKTPRKFPGMVW